MSDTPTLTDDEIETTFTAPTPSAAGDDADGTDAPDGDGDAADGRDGDASDGTDADGVDQ